MEKSYFWIISYDVRDNKRRNKVAAELKNHGVRVQFSVFECIMPDGKAENLIQRLADVIHPKEDSIRFYKICESCKNRIFIQGQGKISRDEDVYII